MKDEEEEGVINRDYRMLLITGYIIWTGFSAARY
jgi:hypothetical protein